MFCGTSGYLQEVEKGTLGPEGKTWREQMSKNNPNKAPVFPKHIINLSYPRKQVQLNDFFFFFLHVFPKTSNETEQRGGKNALVLLMYLRGTQKSLRSQSNYECIMFFVLSTRSIKYIFFSIFLNFLLINPDLHLLGKKLTISFFLYMLFVMQK